MRNEWHSGLVPVLGVSRSGYYACAAAAKACARRMIASSWYKSAASIWKSVSAYGAGQNLARLDSRGIACGKHRIARLRRQHGIEALRRRRFKATTYARSGSWAAPDWCTGCFKRRRQLHLGWRRHLHFNPAPVGCIWPC